MSCKIFASVLIVVNVIINVYGLYEGDACSLNDGTHGICKKIENCKPIKEGIKQHVTQTDDIVHCSFMAFTPIVCCTDEANTSLPEKHVDADLSSDKKYYDQIVDDALKNKIELIGFGQITGNDHVISVPDSYGQESNVKDIGKMKYSSRKADAACGRNIQLALNISTALQSADEQGIYSIAGGTATQLGEFPHMAALGYIDPVTRKITYDCGGSIISELYILTAAHCVPKRRIPRTVRLGKTTLLTSDDGLDPVDRRIRAIIKHPDYRLTTKKNDIALIRVAVPIVFSVNVLPVCLRTNLSDVHSNIELTVTGWGSTLAERTKKSPHLLKAKIKTMPLPLCNQTLIDFNRGGNLPSLRDGLTQGQYCAHDASGRDACQGDSGGPLQIDLLQYSISMIVGIVSFGSSCGTTLPGVYTRVAFYVDWIGSYVWPN